RLRVLWLAVRREPLLPTCARLLAAFDRLGAVADDDDGGGERRALEPVVEGRRAAHVDVHRVWFVRGRRTRVDRARIGRAELDGARAAPCNRLGRGLRYAGRDGPLTRDGRPARC